MVSSRFSCREFFEIYSTKEPHQSQKWPIWRPFSWVGDDFVQVFMSRVFWDLQYKRATSITEVSYLETIFMNVESFLRSIVQKSHINHKSDLSGDHFHEWAMILSKSSCREFFEKWDHFHEWAMISSKNSCWEFLEIYNSRQPHQSQKWAIWRPFSRVGDDFVEIFLSRVSRDL